MRTALLLPTFLVFVFPSAQLHAQEALTSANLPDFLSRFEQNFSFVEEAYTDLAKENLPLRDTQGQPLGRRPLEDRRGVISALRQSSPEVAAHPQSLVSVMKIVFQTEELADDLFDLAQVAYDNDREELGRRLAAARKTMEHNKDLLSTYLLSLAAEKEERLKQLEKENAELQLRVKPSTP
jgi:hypothetical protein